SRCEGRGIMSKPQPLPNAGIDGFVVPRHVAIIMDGNGRWASARGLPRSEGHRRGVEALRRTVRAAGDLGIGILTIFSFSSENWSRPPAEIRDLMGLLRRFVRNDLAELHQNGVHVRVIGERDDLAPDIRRMLEEAEDLHRDDDKLTLAVAFNDSARHEGKRDRRIPAPRASLRRPDGADRFVSMADADPARPLGAAKLGGGELALRVGSALVLAPLAIGIAYVGGWLFVVFWGVAAIGVLWEWTSLVAGEDRRAVLMIGGASVVLAVALAGSSGIAAEGVHEVR